jgi:hypothetical protein
MAENNGKTARRGRGRPFEKGTSGNPGGRPKQTTEQKDALQAIRDLAPEAADKLREILRDPDAGWTVKVQAINIILERTYGKPDAHVELTQPDFSALREAVAMMKAGYHED